tara:strand:- start:7961 stop:8833 length:873 start_codon:yes stop_codon:yes gene_type:complete
MSDNFITFPTNKSTFATLMQLEVDQYIQVKPTGFKADYISWCTAWSLVKEKFPDATMEIGEDPTTGLPYFMGVQGIQIKAIVTINGVRQVCWFPVKNSNNKAIPQNKVSEVDIHNATQRAVVKCLAWHGFGLKLWIKDERMLNKIQSEMEEANKAEDNPKKSPPKKSPPKKSPPRRKSKAQLMKDVEREAAKVAAETNERLRKKAEAVKPLCPRPEWEAMQKTWGDTDRVRFQRAIKEINIGYDELKDALYKRGLLKPSSMEREKRILLLQLLQAEGLQVVERLTPDAKK